jgi:glycosyltransferase involved in cell wall biosynthesis
MRSIRLGVIFDQVFTSGGGYHQALNSAIIANQLPKDVAEVVFFTPFRENIKILHDHGIKSEIINFSFFEKLRNRIRCEVENIYLFNLAKKIERYSPFEKFLRKYHINLVYFLSPTGLHKALDELNYITTVWDLCHLDHPEFPEIRLNKEFERREKHYRDILPKATAILVDSKFGKIKISKKYGINPKRLYISPFQPQNAILNYEKKSEVETDIFKKFKINKYIFYPANFWQHKNHAYILRGLYLLEKDYNYKVSAIFTGRDKGNISYIKKYAYDLNISDRVYFLGSVSENEISELYRQSIALVMPSYFGPTNIPPLEAFKIGTPVLYSDIPELKDQVGDAALLLDLHDPNSMAINLKNLIENKNLRQNLINAGYKRLKYFQQIDRLKILKDIIQNFYWKNHAG